jgi:dimethylaniline monooxygenase (N-oxide forming)
MIFPRYTQSVAYLSWMAPQESVWCVCELASMAVAQVWAAATTRDLGSSQPPPVTYRSLATLPSTQEMNREVDQYRQWWRKTWKKDHSMHQGIVQSLKFYRFLHDMAGTRMYETLDHIYTSRGWGLRWEGKELYEWLSNGPMNNYAWRLFDTNPKQIPGCGGKVWPGVRQAVHEAVRLTFLLLTTTKLFSTKDIRITGKRNSAMSHLRRFKLYSSTLRLIFSPQYDYFVRYRSVLLP